MAISRPIVPEGRLKPPRNGSAVPPGRAAERLALRPRNQFLGYSQMSLRDKASDGGDIGCRYTPQMIEMCKIALELRAKGIIKF